MLQIDTVQVIALAGFLGGVIAFLFRAYAAAVKAHLDDITADRDHWRNIAEAAAGLTSRAIEAQVKDKL